MLHNKFWQAFFAIAPLFSMIVVLSGYFFFIFSMIPNLEASDEPPMELFAGMGVFVVLILFVSLISIGSLVFYIIHAVQNPNLKENNLLVVWVLLIILVGSIGKLIYWIIEILGKRKQVT